MKQFLIILLCLFLGGCVGSTIKIVNINVDQNGTKSNTIDFTDSDIKTETDQAADGQLDSAVDASAI